MMILNHIHKLSPCSRKLWGMLLILSLGATPYARAQIQIGGNVYGGGNMGNVGGSTTVHVLSGDVEGSVFGGARMANVGGSAIVDIDGRMTDGDKEIAPKDHNYIVIDHVYGGNDIAGTIGTLKDVNEAIPTLSVSSNIGTEEGKDDIATTVGNITTTEWNALVHISNQKTTVGNVEGDAKQIFIGQLFGGGNGDYYYATPVKVANKEEYTHKVYEWLSDENGNIIEERNEANDALYAAGGKLITTITTSSKNTVKPLLERTYLDIQGGSIMYAYGGGNNATITGKTLIHVDNPSDPVDCIADANITNSTKDANSDTAPEDYDTDFHAFVKNNLLSKARFKQMGLNTVFSRPSSKDQIGRLFGGNNKAEMAIQPSWNLWGGSVHDLYSGGNKGDMIWQEGLLLEIKAGSNIVVENVYGGCRMADVRPKYLVNGVYEPVDEGMIQLTYKDDQGNDLFKFPAGLAARTLIRGGDINNIYGGNDVRGHVVGGNAVGVYTSIRGNIYGGGNGSYAYTDNSALRNSDVYGDFYYSIPSGKSSVEALNDLRPDAEQVSIHLIGTDADHPTIIKGSVFVGGNSASLKSATKPNPKAELKMGYHVIAENVFMGNNGENMINEDILKLYAGSVDPVTGKYSTANGATDFSSLNLKNRQTFATYMDGVSMSHKPSITFDNTANGDNQNYIDYTSYIGSFYCGGNVGSMTYNGTLNMPMTARVIVYDKIVGGCNSASVKPTAYNAAYDGGIIGASNEENYTDNDGNIKDRLVMSISGPRIQPKRWNDEFTELDDGTTLTAGKEYYTTTLRSSKFIADGTEVVDKNSENNKKYYYELKTPGTQLVWNTAKWDDDGTDDRFLATEPTSITTDKDRRLLGGNVYGGCYNSGHVNGNVVINVSEDLYDRVDNAQYNLPGLFVDGSDANTGVILNEQRMDVNAVAMTIFGAGKGKNTEVWGSTTVNLKSGYAFQIFGGGEEGVVGKGAVTYNTDENNDYVVDNDTKYPVRTYDYAKQYSTTVNLRGQNSVHFEGETVPAGMPETEYIYGGGNEGNVIGDTKVYLGNGRLYDAFGGASNAIILGHTEVYIGQQLNDDNQPESGFPWVYDIVYGGNDFGGRIDGYGEYNLYDRVSDFAKTGNKIYGSDGNNVPQIVSKPTAYVEYQMGRVDTIFGGNYGNYNYIDPEFYVDGEQVPMPYLHGTFVNIRPDNDSQKPGKQYSTIKGIFGGSTGSGYAGNRASGESDRVQDHSYVLIDIPQEMDNFRYTEIFGSGSYSGMGMRTKAKERGLNGNATRPGLNLLPSVLATYTEDERIEELNEGTAVVDLIRGKVGAAYGGGFNEGITRRSMVNVPKGSTIDIGSIFGGSYGNVTLSPCDVYEAHVEYHSTKAKLYYDPVRTEKIKDNQDNEIEVKKGNALMQGAIFGGNNNRRRTLYSIVNIDVPLNQYGYYGDTYGTIYGAGLGEKTWSEYTEVNLNGPEESTETNPNPGAHVWEVYGGGLNGLVINSASIQKYISDFYQVQGLGLPKAPRVTDEQDPKYETEEAYNARIAKETADELEQWKDGWTLGGGYDGSNNDFNTAFSSFGVSSTFYVTNPYTNLNNPIVTAREEIKDDPKFKGTAPRFNTNVIINKGATVQRYAYGGGVGSSKEGMEGSGDVYGTTYIALLGGTVKTDIYAAGTTGGVYDAFGVGAFNATNNPYGYTATATAYIEGGTARNVYGGGWKGNVGKHIGGISDPATDDIPGQTYVVIGKRGISDEEAATTARYYDGVPAIQRNAYAGGEGGSIIGEANITINNGYIGYVYMPSGKKQDEKGNIVAAETADGDKYNYNRYEEKINDETYWKEDTWYGKESLADCGNVFGSGYDDKSSADITSVTLYGGHIRNSVFGGGEIATVGRGSTQDANNNVTVYQPGKTHIYMYNGLVERNVFGGGKGYNNLGFGGDNNLHTDGYVFGSTDVNIRGGEIGTESGLTLGYGNVFGGGDQGYVFSATGKKFGQRYDDGKEGYYYTYHEETTSENDVEVTTEVPDNLTEDCKVLVEPWLEVTATDGITLTSAAPEVPGKTHYAKGEYIPTSYLNTLGGRNSGDWVGLDAGSTTLKTGTTNEYDYKERGVIIHNAVFAGGNVSAGKTLNANTNTVFGNATATINDVYHRDLVSIGTRRIGGLYGDGNLTLVDGYRELNITNYGTDYYSMKNNMEITYDEYLQLLPREQDYYEVRYKCVAECQDYFKTTYKPEETDNNGKTTKASTLSFQEMLSLFLKTTVDGNTVIAQGTITSGESPTTEGILNPIKDSNNNIIGWEPNPHFWVQNGVCSIYAGRFMNTIQRADFCGVFGSRMVMQGAQDRVPETVDYTNYTINRVREVSLNQKVSTIDAEDKHGNYFGIYSIVNYLGALTSDVDFGDATTNTTTRGDIRITESDKSEHTSAITKDNVPYKYGNENATYANWKAYHYKDNVRNNGSSHNQVALASGVYLELTTEQSTGTEVAEKDWGLITGVVELDLINVSTGIGGGFVYAKNVHGKRTPHTNQHPPITAQNSGAVSKDDFQYVPTESATKDDHWESSGNFVHSSQTIIDDCYNIGGRYYGNDAVLAHYWFIKGQVYVYDQYISAYTGSPNAYSETVDIPLTITSSSHSEMKLVDVQPNKYAYYSNATTATGALAKLEPGQKLVVNDVEYYLNDPISYWDWYILNETEQHLFVDKTYVNVVSFCKGEVDANGDSIIYEAGTYVMNSDDWAEFTQNYTYTTGHGAKILDDDKKPATKDYVFRQSNNMSHDNGYILTYEVNNPNKWDKWYTPILTSTGDGLKKSTAQYKDLPDLSENTTVGKDAYHDGPTYHTNTAGLRGRQHYKLGDIIPKIDFTTYSAAYNTLGEQLGPDEQAKYAAPNVFEPAYITKEYVEVGENHLQKGAKLAQSEYSNDWSSLEGKIELAYVCTSTIKLSETEFIVAQELLPKSVYDNYKTQNNTAIETLLTGKISNTDPDANGKTKWDYIKDGTYQLTSAEENTLGKANVKELNRLVSLRTELTDYIDQAYYCTAQDEDGIEYGGEWYYTNRNYRAMEVWSSMSEPDRDSFTFNYDAFDLLIDPNFTGDQEKKWQYDGKGFTTEDQAKGNLAGYSIGRPLDYTATFTGEYSNSTGTQVKIDEFIYSYRQGTSEDYTQVKINATTAEKLDPEQFERIPNEQRNYSQFQVPANATPDANDKVTVYIVKEPFMFAGTPYAKGQTIDSDEYNKLRNTELENKITQLQFYSADRGKYFYYCRESYTIGQYGTGTDAITYSSTGTVTTGGNNTTYDIGTAVSAATTTSSNDVTARVNDIGANTINVGYTVPEGYIISAGTYSILVNKQLGFDIHGEAPKEYSTLYVSRNSDIKNLSKEKIITVIYRYDYEDAIDEAGTNIQSVSERHVVNIHIQFKSGIPTVPDINIPAMVLPGDKLGLREPTVTPGAYEIIGSGWELFEEPRYAENHTNGKEYVPGSDKLYWYEDGYYVAYYAKTYLGKHYSNHVPVSVANYHDLKEVMEDKQYHLNVDHKAKRAAKIYINDYTDTDNSSTETVKDGIELLKDFYDLSLVQPTYDDNKQPIAISTHTNTSLIEHTPMRYNDYVQGGKNLEFILKSNIYHSGDWTPIGEEDKCFAGNLHGDGYTISGLKNSLFGNLCGDVYNLGVTGSFTGAGIAETGIGYIENSWISTSAPTKTSRPIYGNPSRNENDYEGSLVQIVNSYYLENDADAYTTANEILTTTPKDGSYTKLIADAETTVGYVDHGTPIRRPAQAFYNGEVTFDLNGFYLNRRYYDGKKLTSGEPFRYIDPEKNDDKTWTDIYYPTDADAKYGYLWYVERRFKDGDFRYANGTIPTGQDKRTREYTKTENVSGTDVTTTETIWMPVYPDDYLFFGQDLTFGWDENRPHQSKPSHYYDDAISSNRVYRVPAYYGNSTMSLAYLNPDAVLAAKEKVTSGDARDAFPGMTAIDFTGKNDATTYSQGAGTVGTMTDIFYAPVLDYAGLSSFRSDGQTRNLLAYADRAADMTILSDYFNDQEVLVREYDINATTDNKDKEANYSVAKLIAQVNGHLVKKQGNDFVADNDQFLVDLNEFNAPFSYSFINDQNGDFHYMWYQRSPKETGELYVKANHQGWQTISLPFTAELVTTDTKGEITHFYNGQNKGHEYWLRELKEVTTSTNSLNEDIYTSTFRSLAANGSETKTDGNLFLWNHYYNKFSSKDKNTDDYYKTYYKDSRSYPNYPYLQAGKPYLIGFPGSDYYEFDLSGEWTPYGTQNDAAFVDNNNNNNTVGAQTITFVSVVNPTIEKTDTEYNNDIKSVELSGSTSDGYTFRTNYKKQDVSADKLYVLDETGNKFVKGAVTEPVTTVPFRPYFTAAPSGNNAQSRSVTRANVLFIGYAGDEDELEEVATQGSLIVYSDHMNICIESTLEYETKVTIYTVAGKQLKQFTIQPGTKVQVPVNSRGVYIVNRQKIAVTK